MSLFDRWWNWGLEKLSVKMSRRYCWHFTWVPLSRVPKLLSRRTDCPAPELMMHPSIQWKEQSPKWDGPSRKVVVKLCWHQNHLKLVKDSWAPFPGILILSVWCAGWEVILLISFQVTLTLQVHGPPWGQQASGSHLISVPTSQSSPSETVPKP